MIQEAQFYKNIKNKKIQCTLCPHYCVLDDGEWGTCRVRIRKKAKLYTKNYGQVSGLHSDHIEKKPLYHFYPSKKILSAGSIGCNMTCSFCQNHEISQPPKIPLPGMQRIRPEEIVARAKKIPDNIGIAYTYNEPTIWYEFVKETAQKARNENLKNVLVSNGFINPEPLSELLPFIDAANIDLKAFNDGFFKKESGARLQPVLKTIKSIARTDTHLEITFLVIPELNDSVKEFKAMLQFIKSEAGPDTVLHLSRYFPAYKSNQPVTPEKTLQTLFDEAEKMLNFVYLGNIDIKSGRNTYCPECKTKLIERNGYNTRLLNISSRGTCTECGYKLLGRNYATKN